MFFCVCVCVCKRDRRRETEREGDGREMWSNSYMYLCVCVHASWVGRFKQAAKINKNKPNTYTGRHTGRHMSDEQRQRRDEWQTRSGRWKDGRVEERKKSIGGTDGWGVSEKKDTAVSQHTQLSRSFCVVSSERRSHSRYIPGKGRCLNAILYCSLPLSLPLARYTPQHRVLIYRNKTKRQYESFEPQWHRSLYRVRTRRSAIPIQTANFKKIRLVVVLGVPKKMIHKEVPALLMLNL